MLIRTDTEFAVSTTACDDQDAPDRDFPPQAAHAATAIGAEDHEPLSPAESVFVYGLIFVGCLACVGALAWGLS